MNHAQKGFDLRGDLRNYKRNRQFHDETDPHADFHDFRSRQVLRRRFLEDPANTAAPLLDEIELAEDPGDDGISDPLNTFFHVLDRHQLDVRHEP